MQMKTEPAQGSVVFGRRIISYTLIRTGRRNLRVIINPDLRIEVYAPSKADTHQIEAAVLRKARWIVKTLDKVESYQPIPAPKLYVSGETFLYLGRQYLLKVLKDSPGPAKLYGRYLRVSLSDPKNTGEVKDLVDRWYREHANSVFARSFERCADVASRHGVSDARFVIRKMKRRWGSCSASGRITLNLDLVQLPVHCIEYVIMHELCHLKYHNHSPSFYRLLTRCQPDWRRRKDILDRFRLV